LQKSYCHTENHTHVKFIVERRNTTTTNQDTATVFKKRNLRKEGKNQGQKSSECQKKVFCVWYEIHQQSSAPCCAAHTHRKLALISILSLLLNPPHMKAETNTKIPVACCCSPIHTQKQKLSNCVNTQQAHMY
jgi:hypothetical protein